MYTYRYMYLSTLYSQNYEFKKFFLVKIKTIFFFPFDGLAEGFKPKRLVIHQQYTIDSS